jgi:hypothetical protein
MEEGITLLTSLSAEEEEEEVASHMSYDEQPANPTPTASDYGSSVTTHHPSLAWTYPLLRSSTLD